MLGTNPYSFGITLQELSMHTCNEKWKECFIDRTQKENKKKPLFKLVNLRHLAFYW